MLTAHKIYQDTLALEVQGKLLVLNELSPNPVPGDVILVRGTMQPIRARKNPADVDYAGYLARRRIHTQLYAEEIVTIKQSDSFKSRFQKIRAQAHRQITTWISRYVNHEEAQALLEALILGEQSRISSSTIVLFRQTGLAHLLAVSGLHMLCVGLVVYTLLRSLCLRTGMGWWSSQIVRTCTTMLLIGVYLLITGPRPSVVRAFLMTSIVITAPLFQRPSASLNSLALTGLVLLAINPLVLFDPGFQLSFSAVASIITLSPRLEAYAPLACLPAYVRSSLTLSVSALVGTVCITLFHFQSASTGGLILNAVAIPLTTAVLLSGLLMLLFAPLLPFVSSLFGSCAEALAWCLLELPRHSAHILPNVNGIPSFGHQLVFTCAGVLVFVYCFCPFRMNWKCLCVCLSIVLCLQWGFISRGHHRPGMDVLFFDVGHGDAALIRLPGGKHVLIDTGDVTHSSQFNASAHHVDRFKIPCLDAVILTHPHRDHIAGVNKFRQNGCRPRIYTNGSDRYARIIQAAAHSARVLKSGDILDLDSSVRIRVLAPCPAMEAYRDGNDGSLVLFVEYGGTRILFTGDAERIAEEHLVKHYPALLASTTIIKVGHHGSATSSTPLFTDTVSNTRLAVISTGSPERYGLPDDEVLVRWRKTSTRIHVTHERGALWIRTDGTSVVEKKW